MGKIADLKKVLFVSVLIVMCVFGLSAQAKYGSGSGTPEDPYLIYTAEQMNEIGLSGNSDDWDKHFRLMVDIDLSGFDGKDGRPSFNIIGTIFDAGFSGVFDGNKKVISNFTHQSNSFYKGLFTRVIGENAEVKDLVLRNVDVNSGTANIVGALAGKLYDGGRLSRCSIEGGIVSGHQMVGGLVGHVSDKSAVMDYCYSTCSIVATGFLPMHAGGLTGINGGMVSNCYSTGSVICTGEQFGGLVGRNTGTISNCYSTSNVNGTAEASQRYVGGLVGYNSFRDQGNPGIIEDSYSLGIVSADYLVGGLVGWNGGHIYNSYTLSSVSGNSHVGGLVGMNVIPSLGGNHGKILNCFSAGSVTGNSSVGGLVGEFTSGTISSSFWDVNTSGQISSDGGIGKTTTEMQTESTFTSAGWDFFTPIWKMCDGPYYPRLWWEICPERPVYYVDADANGANDGSSWADAYKYLQDALDDATNGDDIWVADGTYKPDENSANPSGTGELTATFQLITGVRLYGGFAGGETTLDERDWETNKTILSGDLNGDDIPIYPHNTDDNSYRVVTGSGTNTTSILDGLTISGGRGTGMYNYGGSPTLANCTFSDNVANDGGAMYNTHFSDPVVTNCEFSLNKAGESGGAMCNEDSNPIVTGCTFIDNSALHFGGAVYNGGNSPTFKYCTFIDNSAEAGGGGMYNRDSSPMLTNCTFEGNWSGLFGGGLDTVLESSNPIVIGCSFIGNSADVSGGGTSNGNSSLTLINCIFVDNSAANGGGGMYSHVGKNIKVSNCTFYRNEAPNGNMLACSYESNVQLTNCIMWDSGNEIWNPRGSIITLTYSDVHGGQMSVYDPCEGLVWGEGNIVADPCFADANNGDYHLKSRAGRWDPNSQSWVQDDVNSPCIDAGEPNSDWTAEFWPHGERINMGAYGGTPEASMSLSDAGNIADLNFDRLLCSRDVKLLTDKWLYEAILLPEDLSRDGIVSFIDFAIFAHNFELPARHPNPGDGARVVSRTADLSWTAGRGATSHDVYFGTSNPPPFIQNQTGTTFDPGTMAYSTVYYWRIDEVGAYGTFTGAVWSFTTTGPGPG
ncbi:MAG: GLUG motif-containing protein [Sedimentisphaerales bacterium]